MCPMPDSSKILTPSAPASVSSSSTFKTNVPTEETQTVGIAEVKTAESMEASQTKGISQGVNSGESTRYSGLEAHKDGTDQSALKEQVEEEEVEEEVRLRCQWCSQERWFDLTQLPQFTATALIKNVVE